MRRVLVVAKLGLLALKCPGLAKQRQNASERKVLVGFNFLSEVLGEGPMHGSSQSQIPVGRVGMLEGVLEPPAGMAVHEAPDLRGRKDRSGGRNCGGLGGVHRRFSPLMLISTVIAMDLMASASKRTT